MIAQLCHRPGRLLWVLRTGLALAFVSWSAFFIAKSSAVAPDGQRYFSLSDDAMISMRYAWNVAHGFGPVWNRGERVEGYTNPLWMLVMVPANALLSKRLASLPIQILGFLILLGVAFESGRWMDAALDRAPRSESGERILAPLIAAAATLAYYPLTYWSLMGMETGLVMLVLLIGCRWSRGSPSPSRARAFGYCCAIAYLTRPDAVLLFLPGLVWFLAKSFRARANFLRLHLSAVAPIGLVITIHLALRRFYYGEWLPNTYVLKIQGIPLDARVVNGLAYVEPFLKEHGLVLVLALLATFWLQSEAAILAASVSALCLVYQVWIGGDPWWYWRLLAPCGLLTMLLAVAAVLRSAEIVWAHLAERAASPARPRRLARFGHGLAVGLACLALVASCTWQFRGQTWLWRRPYQADFNEQAVKTALLLDRVLKEDARIAVMGAGAVPYFTGRYAVDLLGKSEKTIARLEPDLVHAPRDTMPYMPGHNKYALNDTFDRYQPDWIEWKSWGGEVLRQEILDKLEPFGSAGFLRAGSNRVNWELLPKALP